MFRLSYFFYAVGILGFLFALGRTYYRLWKLKKDREAPGRRSRPPVDDENKPK